MPETLSLRASARLFFHDRRLSLASSKRTWKASFFSSGAQCFGSLSELRDARYLDGRRSGGYSASDLSLELVSAALGRTDRRRHRPKRRDSHPAEVVEAVGELAEHEAQRSDQVR